MKIQTNNTIVKGILILALSAILYFQDFLFLFNEALNSEVFSHILAIPFMIIYILYRLRKIIYASTEWKPNSLHHIGPLLIKDIIGVILCTLAYSIKWYGSYTFLPVEYHIASLPIFISGLILIMFNFTTLRTLLFPIAFLIFLLPPPLNIIQIVGTALSIFSSQASYGITKFTGIPVELIISYNNPTIYLTTSFGQEISLIVDVACSGLYSLIGFSLFAAFLAYITRGSLKLKGVMLLIGFPVIYSLNILRIVALIYIGYYFGPELALKVFHLLGGWILIFFGTLFLLVISEKFLNVKLRSSITVFCESCTNGILDDVCSTCGKIQNKLELKFNRSEYGKMAIISIIILSLTLIQVPIFAFTNKGADISLYGSETYSSTNIFPEIDNYDFKFVHRDRAFENISGQDASLMYMYDPQNKDNR
ncbi:MAG: exosortase/archaeosortase family protein, partial [Candidatus Hodarchaeales archaeon]